MLEWLARAILRALVWQGVSRLTRRRKTRTFQDY